MQEENSNEAQTQKNKQTSLWTDERKKPSKRNKADIFDQRGPLALSNVDGFEKYDIIYNMNNMNNMIE